MIQYSKENINIMVEIKEAAAKKEVNELTEFIEKQTFTKNGSLTFTTKEEAAEEMKEELGDFTKFGFQNPFRDVLHFNVTADYMNSETLEKIKTRLLSHNAVYNVFFQEAAIFAIERNLKKAGLVMLVLGLLFLFVAITLIHNTIRLALYANRFLIKNMQLVGASWRFISRPYLWKSIQNGFWSALLAIAGLAAVMFLVNLDMPRAQDANMMLGLSVILGGITLLGMTISFMSTLYVVNKYLKMRVDDLY
ncbi:MAG: cell division protein FtsX [Saprospiraceae bacterium]